jgi:aspartyl-tRNA(Asn)/glutamyl-tRNA(Gln) amidotransferase subunit C
MSISREDVERLARLARLSLDAAEIEAMTRDLESILAYIATLRELDRDAAAAEPGDARTGTPLRDDEVRPSLPPGEATALAPGARHDLFRVPPAIGGP